MIGDFEIPDARMIFQSQFDDIIAVQLDLKRVSRFQLAPRREFRLEAELDNNEVVLYLSGKEDSALSEIRATQAEYRMLGREFLGRNYHLIRNQNWDG